MLFHLVNRLYEGSTMPISNLSLSSVPDGFRVDALALNAAGLVVTARTIVTGASCRVCGRPSERVRSAYWRTIQDLPWQDRAVTWRVRVRRFRCGHCPGRIFAEPVPGLGARKARCSDLPAAAQTDIGMVLGGEPGTRLSQRLAMPVSSDTVLRLICRRNTRPPPPPRVVVIDDWAWWRGRSYGTIVCDLERHRVLDLLPGCAAGPVRDWLAAHPSMIGISRDRSGPYAEAARTGAPQARQVADRWHLLVRRVRGVARCCGAPLVRDPGGGVSHRSRFPHLPPSDGNRSYVDRARPATRPLRDGPAPTRRRAADPGDRAQDRRVPQRRAPLGADRLAPPLPQGCGSEPPRSPSPLRRGALAGGPAQRHRPLSRAARARLHGRLRHRSPLGRATTGGRPGPTAVRP